MNPAASDPTSDLPDDKVNERPRTAEQAFAHLCRDTVTTPDMTPAGVAEITTHLAAMAAALPQACAQLSRILSQARRSQVLTMDLATEETDAVMAIGQAQIHLDEARELAVGLHRHLDAARNATVHITSEGTHDS